VVLIEQLVLSGEIQFRIRTWVKFGHSYKAMRHRLVFDATGTLATSFTVFCNCNSERFTTTEKMV